MTYTGVMYRCGMYIWWAALPMNGIIKSKVRLRDLTKRKEPVVSMKL
jgi:hypothetical protein